MIQPEYTCPESPAYCPPAQDNKKEPSEQSLRDNPNTCLLGSSRLDFGKPAFDHLLLIFSCKPSVWYGLTFLLPSLSGECRVAEKLLILILLNKKGDLFSVVAAEILIWLIEQGSL